MNNLWDNQLDSAFKSLIALLDELQEPEFSHAISDVYRELLTSPSKERKAILRACLRSLLAVHPGGINEMYFDTNGSKTNELIESVNIVKSYARRRLGDFRYLPGRL